MSQSTKDLKLPPERIREALAKAKASQRPSKVNQEALQHFLGRHAELQRTTKRDLEAAKSIKRVRVQVTG